MIRKVRKGTYMDQQKYLSSDELLEKIFYYMSRLFEEKELSTTLFLLTDLGKTLVNSDRASFWFWDKRKAVVWVSDQIHSYHACYQFRRQSHRCIPGSE